ncbi:putative HTH-type transcriptional regulator [Mycolicibacterium chlorophenolicum]|uniref:Putative HTH-type transcriptional regulator n=2 Tax=Mycolicibacterium chlorophenolicum TaxID=37916 RepID=A0A0J6VRE1_9MYCO|nr:putative HTH-type transcriptional regulator [Mycolicibacterium chlorophenolicum]
MFAALDHLMLASMSRIDPRAETPSNWSDLGVSELPTGTVTLLLADVEGSTRLWQTQPEEMAAAIARLDHTVWEVISTHHGVRPVEQGEGDSFVVAFARASDAVACALELQRAPLAPIRLRIGLHTGEVQLRDEGNYMGPTINRTARLRDLAHGGQTVLSATTEDLVFDRLPADAWLIDLGAHQLRDLPRLERIAQLCHPDLRNDFAVLRTGETVVSQHLPVQLTSFVGREAEMRDVRRLLADSRLVTLTGAGGVGKTRLAVQVAAGIADEFGGGVGLVDLAPITDSDLVPLTVIRALGLPDHPGRSTMDTLLRFIGGRRLLLVLDNCEHLLAACAELVVALQGGCPAVRLMATSREPIGVPGEVHWRVPSLSLADEAMELFADRARHVRPDFCLTESNSATVAEICRRLDGVPLALELAAARVRVLSLNEIRDSLHDRFRLLTGGARTAVRRQQTLRASVDWSFGLLTQPERIVFARLAVFVGGFDLNAAETVGGGDDVQSHHVLDLLTLLVDKSLVVAEMTSGATRYRMLETMRQYALEKLGESGHGDDVRARHRDHFTGLAAVLDAPAGRDYEEHIDRVRSEIDNLRAAFAWSRENSDLELASHLASSLQPLWLARGRIREGMAWFDAVLADGAAHPIDVAPAVRARALAENAVLDVYMGATDRAERAWEALTIARDIDDPALVLRALTACGGIAVYDPEAGRPYLAEAIDLARSIGDTWGLSQILGLQAFAAVMAGDLPVALAAAEEGRDLADAIGNRFDSRACRWALGTARGMAGDLVGAVAQLQEVAAEADVSRDVLWRSGALSLQAVMQAWHGGLSEARDAANSAITAAAPLGAFHPGLAYAGLTFATLAAGDVAAAEDAAAACRSHFDAYPKMGAIWIGITAYAALARGDVTAARQRADDAVAATTGSHRAQALIARALVASFQGEPEQTERDAHDALAVLAGMQAYGGVPTALECLARLAVDAGRHREAARHLGAADAIRQSIGQVLFRIFDAVYEASLAALRDAMGEEDFESAWAEGAAMSADEAIAYAQRRRGERKRPTSGWASLTPAERNVVRLVSEGLATNDIATRLFVSPRTVQTHLTHIYAKLGVSSRIKLAQEAARQNERAV